MGHVKFAKDHFKFFKCCVPQILLGPFLNTLTHFLKGKFWAKVLKAKITSLLFRILVFFV